ncbi:MAG: DUF1552 domain-containing protein [Myxococcales bacterium]|nr:DUF1552 domain-containing protein [Myxococcales bacterium]
MSRTPSRRAFLRGAGSIAIALPLLPELMSVARAQSDDGVPWRLFTMSFGLGIEHAMQLERFDGPLQPLAPFADKAAFFTNVDGGGLASSGTPHFSTSSALFTGVHQQGSSGNYHAGGPSMEQVMKRALFPNGVPNVSAAEISCGLWSRTGADSQFTRQWNSDGSPGPRPERRPSRIFDALFGSFEPDATKPDPERLARDHVHRSVLDTVTEQYRSLLSDRSVLGARSKARLQLHLDAIRSSELQLAPTEGKLPGGLACDPPEASDYLDPEGHSFYDAASGPVGPSSPSIDWQVADEVMQLLGELLALGMSCDAVRFGSLIFVGGGGHVRFDGTYEALGGSLDFGDRFAGGSPHDLIFHSYDATAIRLYQHFSIRQLAHALSAMDAIVESNGRTVLDNSLVLMGTEYGKNHDVEHAFHAVLGGGGRFASGWYDQQLGPEHVYHEALAAYGVDSGIPGLWSGFESTDISGFRVA